MKKLRILPSVVSKKVPVGPSRTHVSPPSTPCTRADEVTEISPMAATDGAAEVMAVGEVAETEQPSEEIPRDPRLSTSRLRAAAHASVSVVAKEEPEEDPSEDKSPASSSPKKKGLTKRLTVLASPSRPSRSSRSSKKAEEEQYQSNHVIDLFDTEPRVVEVHVNHKGQHTISWEKAIDACPDNDIDDAMEDGLPEKSSCNLYLFPTITTPREQRGERPSKAGIKVLRRMLIHLAKTTNVMMTQDEVGAFPIHALVVCNTPESLALSLELFELVPALLAQVHVPHRAGIPLFVGESSLHICAVNRQEKAFLRIVELANKHLEPAQAKQMFNSQAAGIFFKDRPMVQYGGTAVAYACCFELKDAVLALLQTGHVDMNSRADACSMSGFLPVHAIVANGLVNMYEFTTLELPHVLRADPGQVTKIGAVMRQALTCLQLAANMGNHRMVRYILKAQCDILWIWGPVTQFSLDLHGIDSSGEGGGDIMELITRMDASRKTQEMLLDSFMNGFIYHLFNEKWSLKYGRKLHYLRRSLDFVMLALLLVFSHVLKSTPALDDTTTALAVGMLVVSLLIVEEEVRTAYLFARNEQGVGDSRRSKWELLKLALGFCRLHSVYVQFMGLAAAASIALTVLLAPSETLLPPAPLYDPLADENVTTIRALAARGGQGAVATPAEMVVYDEGNWAYMWIVLTISQLFLMSHFALVIFMPFEKLNIMLLSIINMLKDDVAVYMVAFLWAATAFFESLFTLYPRSGSNDFPLATKFNNVYDGIKAIVELAFIGEPVPLYIDFFNPDIGDPLTLSAGMSIAIVLWILLYVFLIIMFIILLLNLLIAMMAHTFDRVNEEATLQSRLSYSQCIIKLELVAESLGMDTHVGKKVGPTEAPKYVYEFRSVDRSRNGEEDDVSEDGYSGDIDQGGADPFQDPAQPAIGRVEEGMKAGLASIEASLSSLQTVIVNQHKMLINTAKGDVSWVDDPNIVGDLAPKTEDDDTADLPEVPSDQSTAKGRASDSGT